MKHATLIEFFKCLSDVAEARRRLNVARDHRDPEEMPICCFELDVKSAEDRARLLLEYLRPNYSRQFKELQALLNEPRET